MRFLYGVASTVFLVSGLAIAAPNLAPRAPTVDEIQGAKSVDDFRDLAMQALEAQQHDLQRRGEQGSCTLQNARVRRDWYVYAAVFSFTLPFLIIPRLIISTLGSI
jgi:hypothetical protein